MRELAEQLRAGASVAALYEQLPRPVRNAYAERTLEPTVTFRCVGKHSRTGEAFEDVLASERDLYVRTRSTGLRVRECRHCKRREKRGKTQEQERQELLKAKLQKSPAQP